MLLSSLLADLPGVRAVAGDLRVEISRIVADSRQVEPGSLFVAYRGTGVDGHRFIDDALRRGAVAVLGEIPLADLPDLAGAPYIQAVDGREALGWLSAAWEGHPSRLMTLVGVTGTDGKTTTANLLYSMLRAAGRNIGLISTVNAVIGDQPHDTGLHTTTPDAPDIQRYLARMRDAGAQAAIIETTSHGLAQHRVTACAFDVAVVTNITHEHLDYHGSYEAYREAKATLFRLLATTPRKPGQLKTKVLNADDPSYDFLLGIPSDRTIVYGLGGRQGGRPALPATELWAVNVRHTTGGMQFEVEVWPVSDARAPDRWILTTRLIGAYNVSNILAAAGAALALGVTPEDIAEGVLRVSGVVGRMERIERGQDFEAIVDFAHTPNALSAALRAARGLTGPGGQVIVVFGSAGLRDRAKRRLMGSVAAQHADLAVVTAEDPRTEDLAGIMAETADALRDAGKVEGQDFVQIADRQRAILFAVQQARRGDVVMVCGKGHEQSMCFGVVEHSWRDQEAVAWALEAQRAAVQTRPPFILPTWVDSTP